MENFMQPRMIFAATLLTAFSCSASFAAGAEIDLSSERAQFSYAIGQRIANGLIRDQLDLDMGVVATALRDAAAGTAQLPIEQQMSALQRYRDQQLNQTNQTATKNEKAGQDYLAKNRLTEGVTETSSGLQYSVVTSVDEGAHPTDVADVTVHYRGTLIDGTQFDSSYDRGEPATFNVAQVIPGWQEALQLMKPGETFRLTIPAELAYGENAPPSIGPNQVLLFDVELISIN
jgi:FKBP-type peptidyl-prolyl cis-trans isomerase